MTTSATVRISIGYDGGQPDTVLEVALAAPAVYALNRFVEDNPQYQDIARLMISHVQKTLIADVMARYPDEGASTAIQAAEAEVARLKAVAAEAAVPTISEVTP